LGMPLHPLLLSSNMRSLIPNSCFNFSTMIIVYIMEIASLFLSFRFLGSFFQSFFENRKHKKILFLLCLVYFCFFFALSRKTKTTKRFAFFSAFSYFLFRSCLLPFSF
jgi:hypothetical protein